MKIKGKEMNILDLDLDFFQNGRITQCFGSNIGNVTAWSQSDVIDYIENNLNLKGKKRPGRIFLKHDKAFFFWRDLISKNKLQFPFHIDHVDAHSDLCIGYGNPDWVPFMNQYMNQYYANRQNFPLSGMNEGNYLCYAIAKKWISSLNFIFNDTDKTYNGQDYSHLIMENFDTNGNKIQLRGFVNLIGSETDCPVDMKRKIKNTDPPVPFCRIPGSQFRSNIDYDFVNLSISPQYIDKKSIKHVKVFARYIDFL